MPNSLWEEPKAKGELRRDYLREHSRKAASALGAAAIILLVASVMADSTKGLPSIAFGWKFGLDIVRAAVVFAVVTTVMIVLVRGWGGIWPQRISTSGIDYDSLSQAAFELGHEKARMETLEAELNTAATSEKGDE